MASVVHVDDVLLFGPDEKNVKEALNQLELQKFDFKLEKDSKTSSCDFLGINISEVEVDGKKTTKMTQLGPIKKFLECTGMSECKPNSTPCTVQPLGTNAKGKQHSED